MERICTPRLFAEPMTEEELEALAESVRQTDPELAEAYGEMLDGCRKCPAQYLFYTAWRITAREGGGMVGDFCFKGLPADGCPEIGYGILEPFWGRGYATEIVRAACLWALTKDGIRAVLAETDPDNKASQRVLAKIGFVPTGEMGEEGPRYRLEKPFAE